jgi:hypothetical protein
MPDNTFVPGQGGSYQLNEDGTVDLVERTQEAPPAPPAPEPDQQ